ncbi:MAG: hypothetical protein DHS20C13_21390 [Thermodesulfobacteriota bacterium]|nr:MAG: hypothetical protein DHS20C13_21390 [Thermodesulfobacteriota bacterium]
MKQKDSKWLRPPKAPELLPNEIHIWRTYLYFNGHSTNHFYSILSEDEKSKANRFRFEKDKKRFVITRGLLRETLGLYLEIDSKDLDFNYNKYGKPSLTNPGKSRLEFNLSHSGDVILYSFAKERKLGIDVERLRPIKKAQKIVERFFSEKEQQYYNTQNATEKDSTFFKLWTYKEAYTKAKGLGLALPLNQFDVPLSNRPLPPNSSYTTQWTWQEINLAPDYVAAIAVEGSGFEIKQWDFDKTE